MQCTGHLKIAKKPVSNLESDCRKVGGPISPSPNQKIGNASNSIVVLLVIVMLKKLDRLC